jgi:hypothetical protein
MTPGNTPTPPTQVGDNPQNYWQGTTDASTDATDTSATDAGGPLLIRADGGASTNHTQENHHMPYPENPARWPMRPHTGIYCVRWRYPHWVTDSDGCYRWHTRWFVISSAATRFADRLRASGAVVHRDLYRTEFVCRIDVNNSDVFGPDDLEVTK